MSQFPLHITTVLCVARDIISIPTIPTSGILWTRCCSLKPNPIIIDETALHPRLEPGRYYQICGPLNADEASNLLTVVAVPSMVIPIQPIAIRDEALANKSIVKGTGKIVSLNVQEASARHGLRWLIVVEHQGTSLVTFHVKYYINESQILLLNHARLEPGSIMHLQGRVVQCCQCEGPWVVRATHIRMARQA